MGFQVSPGVEVKEIDLTNVIPAVSTSIGGFAGYFKWGPVNDVSLISSEKQLLQKFGTPDSSVLYADPFFQAASFLNYGGALKVVRAGSSDSFSNATDNGGPEDSSGVETIDATGLVDGTYTQLIDTQSLEFDVVSEVATITTNITSVIANQIASFDITDQAKIIAEYDLATIDVSGLSDGTYTATIGGQSKTFVVVSGATTLPTVTQSRTNEASVDVYDSVADATVTVPLTWTDVTPASITVELTYRQLLDGVWIPNQEYFEEGSFSDPESGTFAAKYPGAAGNSLKVYTLNATTFAAIKSGIEAETATAEEASIYNSFDLAPEGDEIHVAIVDVNGVFGEAGLVVEKFQGVSVSKTAKTETGATNYIKNVINAQSRYVYLIAGDTTAFVVGDFTASYTLSSGMEAEDETKLNSDVKSALDLLADTEIEDVNLIFSQILTTGADLQNYAHQIAYTRKDAVAFMSPPKSATVAQIEPLSKVREFANNPGMKRDNDGSYGVIDSGAVYIYDRYNDVYRYIPANGHVAGLCANTDDVAEPWFSPAGFNRGGLRGVVKLAYNPKKADRDELYKAGINPVVTMPGQGTLLFGDKTAQSKPSAFDRINVRRLFIVLEKAIATAAKYQLFELNDEFTRATFRNAVEPFLRDVQGRRGITDFMVVCDETNNTGEVIDTNRFVADIYIKPARSINFITLNFIATRTGVDFAEIAGLSNA